MLTLDYLSLGKYINSAKFRTKIILMNSLVISIFRYCCPLLINSNMKQIARLQTLFMKCTRHILGFKSFKMSTLNIVKELKMLTIYQMIMKDAILFIHKVIFNKKPSAIFKFITFGGKENSAVRRVRKPRIKIETNSSKVRYSLLYNSIYLYCKLEDKIRLYNPKKLAKYLKENILYIFLHDNILRQPSN